VILLQQKLKYLAGTQDVEFTSDLSATDATSRVGTSSASAALDAKIAAKSSMITSRATTRNLDKGSTGGASSTFAALDAKIAAKKSSDERNKITSHGGSKSGPEILPSSPPPASMYHESLFTTNNRSTYMKESTLEDELSNRKHVNKLPPAPEILLTKTRSDMANNPDFQQKNTF